MHSVESTHRSNMMKLAVSVLAVLALSSPMEAYTIPTTGNGALAKELQDFIDIIPIDQMVAVLLEYVSEDTEFQQLLTYLHSDDFKALISDIEAIPDVKRLFNYMQGAGVDVYEMVNKVNDFIGLQRLTPPATFQARKISGGIRGFFDDIEALYPNDKMKALYLDKMANSPVFQDFMSKLRTPEAQKVADTICANTHFQNLLARAKAAHVDLPLVKKIVEFLLGVNVANCAAA